MYPRCIHSELLTHRQFSRNAASSRAIPLAKTLEQVKENPYIPFHWGKNQSGMQAYEKLSEEEEALCRWKWWEASKDAYYSVCDMHERGLHKQIANRLLEPFMFISVVLSTTSFRHFEILRTHEAAEPHLQYLANLMVTARSQSVPEALKPGEWHLPLIYDEDRSRLNLSDLKRVSTARCAAVSYIRHGERKDYEKDFALYERLTTGKHLSPMEHLATPDCFRLVDLFPTLHPKGQKWKSNGYCGNFLGWKQHRKEMEGEFVPDEKYTGVTR